MTDAAQPDDQLGPGTEQDDDAFAPDGQPLPLERDGGAALLPVRERRRRGGWLVPSLLLLLALFDLRIELQLLADHFTFTSVLTAIGSHPLAVLVLVLQPSLWSHYRRRRS